MKREYRPELSPSFWGRRKPRMVPRAMDRLEGLTTEQVAAVERICQDIFVDMDNARFSLTETLVACYLSGVHHTLSMMQEGKLG